MISDSAWLAIGISCTALAWLVDYAGRRLVRRQAERAAVRQAMRRMGRW